MAAKDTFHFVVRSALEKEGWTITHDPLYFKVDRDKLYIDCLLYTSDAADD